MKPRRRVIAILLAPLVVVVLMEAMLQVGALFVRAGARAMPRNWLTDHTRVLALGDSNTYGLYLQPEAAFPAQLERSWNERHPDQPIEVLNAGYPGMNSFRLLDTVDTLMRTTRPDVVLLTIGANDLLTPVEEIARPQDSTLERGVRAILRHSRLHRLIHMVRQSRQVSLEHEMDWRTLEWQDDANARIGKILEYRDAHARDAGVQVMNADGRELVMVKGGDQSKSLSNLGENLTGILDVVRRYDAEPYLLTYGASMDLYELTNHVTRNFADGHEVRFIDIAREMQTSCPVSNQCPELFFGDLHPTEQGYAIVAGIVSTRLARDWGLGE